MNELHFGDNLDILRVMPAETVDLIYLDPPFNSNADYNLLYGTKRGGPSQAQAHAFEDMWKWGPDAKRALDQIARPERKPSKNRVEGQWELLLPITGTQDAAEAPARKRPKRAGIGFSSALDDDGKPYACGITYSKPKKAKKHWTNLEDSD